MPRAPQSEQELQLADHLPYESATEFIRLYGHLVTAGGFLLRHRLSPAVGAAVSFDLRLVDDRPMLQGRGLVRWCRTDVGGGAVMGIQFTSLEAESRRLLDLLLVTRGTDGRSDEPPPPPEDVNPAKPRPSKDFPRIAPMVPAVAPRVRPPAVVPAIPPLKPGAAKGIVPAVPVAPRSSPPVAGPAVGPPEPEAAAFTYLPASDPRTLDDTAARTGLIGLPPNLKRVTPEQRAEKRATREVGVPDPEARGSGGPTPPRPRREEQEQVAPFAVAPVPLPSPTTAAPAPRRAGAPSAPLDEPPAPRVRSEPAAPPSSRPPEGRLASDLFGRVEGSEAASASVAPRNERTQTAAQTALGSAPGHILPASSSGLPPELSLGEDELDRAFTAAEHRVPLEVSPASSAAVPAPAPTTPSPVPVRPVAPAQLSAPLASPSPASAGPAPASMEVTPRDAARSGLEALRISRAIEALRRKEFDKAEAQLQQAIADDPQNGRLRFELGLVYFEWSDSRSRDHDGAAEAAFARAAELDPTLDQPLVYLGQVQLRRHLWTDARRSFTEALQRNPHSRGGTEGLEVLQGLQVRQTITRGAMAAAALLLVAGPLLWFGLGSSASQANAANGPLAAAAAPPTVPVATPAAGAPPVVAAAPTAAATPAPTATVPATAPASQVASAPSVVPEAQQPAEGVERDQGPARARRATPRQSKPATGTGGNAAALVRQGDGALREGKVDEALAHFNKALASNSSYAPAHRGLGSVYVMQGKDAEALAAYRKYLSLAPNASDAARIRALVAGME